MRVPYLPETVRVMLREHTLEAAAKNGSAGPLPIFIYRPLNFVESMEWASKAQGDFASQGKVVGELFRARMLKVENLTIGDEDEPFDATNPRHVDAIDPAWVTEIGWAILNRSRLDGDSAGKSS